jgi:hypothetical protein
MQGRLRRNPHLCIQKLLPLLKQDGRSLNDYTSSLVRKGLEVEIQQAMEVLQVLRGDPVQLTNFESKEDQEMALKVFRLVKDGSGPANAPNSG